MRDDASDFVLFHETTHEVGELYYPLNEGATDLIAQAIYNHSHAEDDQIGSDALIYDDQIATFHALDDMTGGRLGLYNLSHYYPGDADLITSNVQFMEDLNAAIGLPWLGLALLKCGDELASEHQHTETGGVLIQVRSLLVRRQADFLKAMLVGDDGKRERPNNLSELAERILEPGTIGKYSQGTIVSGLEIVAAAFKYAKELQQAEG